MPAAGPILYFDGECNLCNRSVQFVIRHDAKKQFRFASLQSAAGKVVLQSFGGRAPDSLILEYAGRYRVRSTAALYTLKFLGGAWSLLFVFIAVPPVLRDWIYDFISRHRYRWFGKRDQCMIPTPELRSRFLS